MDESSSANVPASDAELLNTIRSGGTGAPALLRGRHAAAARALAGQLVSGQAAADDVAARAFAQVLDAIRRGGGPTDAFRPYLLTAVRRAAGGSRGNANAEIPTDEQQIPDPGQPFAPAAAGRDAALLVAAFLSLPERWRAVLWHTEIERAAPSQVAPLLGLPAAGVTELAGRAADGLRQACRQLQAADASREQAGLADIGAALRGTVAPLVLGDAAAAYLASAAGSASPGALASPGSPTSASCPGSPGPARSPGAGRAALRNATAGTAVALLPGKPRRASRRQHALAAGALLTTFGVAAYMLTPAPAAVLVTADGQSTAAGHRAVPGHRTSAIALGPPVLPASAQAPGRRPARPPVTSHRDSSTRQPPQAAVPAVATAPGTPPAGSPAQRPRAHLPATPRPAAPPRQRPRAQPTTSPGNPVLATSWHMPGADGTGGFAAADSRRPGLPGWRAASWRGASGHQATPGQPAWQARSWQPPAWPGAQWHMPSWRGASWHMPAWPGQRTQWQGWPGNR